MNLKYGFLMIFLFIGLITVPNCIFAHEYQNTNSKMVINSDLNSITLSNIMPPLLKASSSKTKIHTDDADVSGDLSGVDWTTIIIIIIVALVIIGILLWYFVLRK